MQNVFVALENIRSLYNVGAILRTCSFFGINNVILVGYSGSYTTPGGKKLLHEKVAKTSLGAYQNMTITFLKNSADLIAFAKSKNLKVLAVEQSEKSVPLHLWKPKQDCVIVLGNEKEGVSKEILEAADKVLEISRYGRHNSLNVSTTAGIVLYHLATNPN